MPPDAENIYRGGGFKPGTGEEGFIGLYAKPRQEKLSGENEEK